jgi:hypothetical protein
MGFPLWVALVIGADFSLEPVLPCQESLRGDCCVGLLDFQIFYDFFYVFFLYVLGIALLLV